MAEQDTSKESRRARRRSENEAASTDDAVRADQDESLSDEATSEAAAEEPSERVGDASEGEQAPMNRRQRRAAAAGGGSDEVRDRNQRLRETARARRGERRQERDTAVARGLDTSEMVDDALARTTHAAGRFLRKNFQLLQWVVVVGVVGGISWQIYSWRANKRTESISDQLMKAVSAEFAAVGEAPVGNAAELETGPRFPTEEARLKAASEAYRKVVDQHGGANAGALARMGLAGLRYDQGKYDDALAAYREVRDSKLAQSDADLRLRALEGIGLAQEAKGDLDGAMKSFKELGNTDVFGFKALGQFHQARLLFAKGEKDKAKELLSKLKQDLGKPETPTERLVYLDGAVNDLLQEIDPSAAPSPSMFSPDGPQDPSQIQELLKQLNLNAPPAAPPAPEPAPGAPAPEPAAPAPAAPGPASPAPAAPAPAAPAPAAPAPAAPAQPETPQP